MVLDVIEQLFKDLSLLSVETETMNKLILGRLNGQVDHPDNNAAYRASSLGKPWILHVLNKWYGGSSRNVYLDQAMKMFEGRVAQAWAEVILTLGKVSFTTEGTVTYGPVVGHYDILITSGGERLVLEVKSMSNHVLKAFRNNPNDDYGYLSQVSFYAHVLDAKAAFLLFDRSIGKFYLVPIMPQVVEQKMLRLNMALDKLKVLAPYDIETLAAMEIIPPAIGGKIPTSMSRSRWSDYCYEYRDGGYHVVDKQKLIDSISALPQYRLDGEQLVIPGLE